MPLTVRVNESLRANGTRRTFFLFGFYTIQEDNYCVDVCVIREGASERRLLTAVWLTKVQRQKQRPQEPLSVHIPPKPHTQNLAPSRTHSRIALCCCFVITVRYLPSNTIYPSLSNNRHFALSDWFIPFSLFVARVSSSRQINQWIFASCHRR
jgi:hypothetical protein